MQKSFYPQFRGDCLGLFRKSYGLGIAFVGLKNSLPPLPGTMVLLQPNYCQPPGGWMDQSNASLVRDDLAAGFCEAVGLCK
jgi:hypothetical protein